MRLNIDCLHPAIKKSYEENRDMAESEKNWTQLYLMHMPKETINKAKHAWNISVFRSCKWNKLKPYEKYLYIMGGMI